MGQPVVNLEICSAFRVEMRAVANGLDLARERCIPKLLVQMDNEACIAILDNEKFQGGEMIGWCTMHVYRKANKVADWLANFGVGYEGRLKIFDDILRALAHLLHEDASGVTFARIVSFN
ncbi:hypothetical protein RDABS01_016135 [Bienertia sinuspersici]